MGRRVHQKKNPNPKKSLFQILTWSQKNEPEVAKRKSRQHQVNLTQILKTVADPRRGRGSRKTPMTVVMRMEKRKMVTRVRLKMTVPQRGDIISEKSSRTKN